MRFHDIQNVIVANAHVTSARIRGDELQAESIQAEYAACTVEELRMPALVVSGHFCDNADLLLQ